MKTLKFTSLALLIMALVSFTGTPISYSSSNDDNHLSANDSVYSPPGYMNKDIQQARSLTDKYLANKDKADNKTEATQREVSQKVQAQAVDKPKPQLKQKQSSKGKSNTQAAAALVVASNSGSADIPAYIRDNVQAYINAQNAVAELNSTPEYEIKQVGQKYFAAWAEGSGSIKSQIFDSSGSATLATPKLITSSSSATMALMQLAALSNGNVAVFWEESTYSFLRQYTYKSQVFDSSGVAQSDVNSIASGQAHTNHVSINTIASFANNNMVVFYNEENSLKYQMLDSYGRALSSATPITNYALSTNITTLANGDTAVMWADSDEYGLSSVKSQIFYASGEAVSSISTIAGDDNMVGYVYSGNLTGLANGNIIASWEESNLDGNYSYKTRILDSSGNPMSDAKTITTDNTGLVMRSDYRITPLSGGDIVVFWTESEAYNNYSIKSRILDSSGNPISDTNSITGPALLTDASIYNISFLSNGNIALFWNERGLNNDGYFKSQVFDSSGKAASDMKTIANTLVYTGDINTLANGNIAVSWGMPGYLNLQVFDSSGNALSFAKPLTGGRVLDWASLSNITTLADGNIVVFWQEGVYRNNNVWNPNYTLKMQTFSSTGEALSTAQTISNSSGYVTVSDIATLSNGDIAVFWAGNPEGNYAYRSQVIDLYGNFKSSDALKPPPPITSLGELGRSMINNPNINPFNVNFLNNESPYDMPQANTFTEGKDLSGIFKALLTDGGMLAPNLEGRANPQLAERIGKDSFRESALAIPVKDFNAADMEAATRLTNILNNPSEDQKVIIDVLKALLGDTGKAQDVSGNQSPELKKASDDLLQMVANILLAQAVPDLLNKGDVSNIKAMFSELDTQRNKIMLEYAQSTKPYYENMIKDLAKNMAMLQAKNLLNPNMSKDELSKLPPSELDKILDKIRNMKDKSFEEKYLLQQEAKYRQDYLDPNNKKLESDMKGMLKNFTGRINDVLKSSDKK